MNVCKEMCEQFSQLMPKPNTYEKWLLKGTVCEVKPLNAAEKQYIDTLVKMAGGYRQFKPQQCYFNAQSLFLRDLGGKLEYWEGWWSSPDLPIPVHHGWLMLNGKVIDVTNEALVRKYGEDRERHYFGVRIDRVALIKHQLRYETYSPLTDTPDGIRLILWDDKNPSDLPRRNPRLK